MRTRILALASVLTLAAPAAASAADATDWYAVPSTGPLVAEVAADAPDAAPVDLRAGQPAADTPPADEPRIPEGVTVAKVPVAGLTAAEAQAQLETLFAQRLDLRVGRKHFIVSPGQLELRVNLAAAVAEALARTAPGNVYVAIRLDRDRLASLEQYITKRTTLPARDASWRIARTPRLRKEVVGQALAPERLHERLILSLSRPLRRTTRLVRGPVFPEVRNNELGPVVTISIDDKLLRYFVATRKGKVVRAGQFGVATGQPSFPTPRGLRHVQDMQRNPWWYPPDSDWAAGAEPIPPGPGNPLGTRWMGLGDAVGIHGTPDEASIGYSASHGCIRMRVVQAEWLFDHIAIGTPVLIY